MFGNFFKRNKPVPPPKKKEWETQLIWRPAGDPENPFSKRVLDCRSVALSFMSATTDVSIIRKFDRLRTSDGHEVRGRLPKKVLSVDCELRFPYKGAHNDGPIFMAREMEDKWDFFTFGNHLYVRRSWTGILVFVAALEYLQDAVVIRSLHFEPSQVFSNSDLAVAEIDFMIKSHLGGNIVPFPILPSVAETEVRTIALHGFSSHGRRAQFAAYLPVSNGIT